MLKLTIAFVITIVCIRLFFRYKKKIQQLLDLCIRIIVMCRGLAPFHYHYANSARLSSH